MTRFIKWFEEISIKDAQRVGGKDAALGEMFRPLAPQGIRILRGFAKAPDVVLKTINFVLDAEKKCDTDSDQNHEDRL